MNADRPLTFSRFESQLGWIRWSTGLSGMLAIFLLVSGCASSRAAPEVIEPVLPAAEQPAQHNLEMIRALSQLNELKEELKLLRNTVEEMQFQQENGNRRQKDLFQDIDRRLLGLERADKEQQAQAEALVQQQGPLTPSEEILFEGQTGVSRSGTPTVSTPKLADSVTVAAVTPNKTIPNIGSAGSSSVSLNEQEAYDAAFEMLKQSRYQDAINQFQALANTWPDSQLADDALYWMSEANYVNREFEAALNGFRTIVENYPDSSRLPEAMLKVGYIQYDIGAYDQAAKTFQDILARFPGNQVTVSAETRLRRIQQTIQ